MPSTSFRIAVVLGVAVALLMAETIRAQVPIVINIVGQGGNARFVPAQGNVPVTVRVGQVVRWVNQGNVPHTARNIPIDGQAGVGVIFDTGFLMPGQSADVTFDEPNFRAAGVTAGALAVRYECEVHPMMTGTITLEGTGTGPHPAPDPATERVIEGETRGANFVWTPQSLEDVKAGDVVVWRIANVSNPGIHNLQITDWANTQRFFEVLEGHEFNNTTGQTGGSNTPGAVLLKVRMRMAPPAGSPLRFFCPTHGEQVMNGLLSAEKFVNLEATTDTTPILTTPTAAIAAFDMQKVTDREKDSYYVISGDFNADGKRDLVTSGLGVPGIEKAEVAWYENPTWAKRVIGYFDVPVALAAYDVDGDGLEDIAITDDYGKCIFDCRPGSGLVAWLKNPGKLNLAQDWKRYEIGSHLASHRLRFGYFTQTENLELLSVPVVGGASGRINDKIAIKVFTRPSDVLNTSRWPDVTVDQSLSVIHEIEVKKFGNGARARLDSVLTASAEGVTWLRHEGDVAWSMTMIGAGDRSQIGKSAARWTGSGSVDAGRIGCDAFAYVAATEPFHGNLLALYTKDMANSLHEITWRRRVIDVIGPISNRGEGPGHHVKTLDVDGDGRDELLVGLRGPLPNSGVHLYRIDDAEAGKVARQQISPFSAAEVLVDDFDGDGRPDFATIPYRVDSYIVAEDTEVMVFYNRTPQRTEKSAAAGE